LTSAPPIALTIAGSDSGGGAGIQADLKTFHRFGVYGTSVVTLITAQNTAAVHGVHVLPPELMLAQLAAVLDDLPPRAAKTGALGNAAMVKALCSAARNFRFPLIVDPVAISKHGYALLDADGMQALREELFPLAALVTPNLPEAEALTGLRVGNRAEMQAAAIHIAKMGPRAVLVKGGHLPGGDAFDIFYNGSAFQEFSAPRIDTRHTHGTGCTYSAAITAGLALGRSMSAAIADAKQFVTRAIAQNPQLGSGSGPLNHWI
jgi:hydroxymethylpyrimidine/phosphomethylpyrimidine kinase